MTPVLHTYMGRAKRWIQGKMRRKDAEIAGAAGAQLELMPVQGRIPRGGGDSAEAAD